MSERRPNALHDDSIMTWTTKYRGWRLGEIPDSFWRWLLDQDWAEEKYPEYVEYAELVEDE